MPRPPLVSHRPGATDFGEKTWATTAWPNRYGESTLQEGWHLPLEPGEYYVESWTPDWASRSEENVIDVEIDPARPLPERLVLK
jgi:hypothetical protein